MKFNYWEVYRQPEDGGDVNVGGADVEPEKTGTDESDEGEGGKKQETDEEKQRLIKESVNRKKTIRKQADEIDGLKADLEKTKEALQAFGEATPEQLQALLKEKQEAEEKALEGEKNWDALKKRMAVEHQKELTKMKDDLAAEVEALKESLSGKDKIINELTVGDKFNSSKYLSEKTNLTPRMARRMYGDLFEAQGTSVVGYNKHSGEDRVMLVDGNGDALDFDKAIESLIANDPDRDNILLSDIQKGANSGGNDQQSSGKVDSNQKTNVSGIDRIKQALDESSKT